jgi:hypothetical protein
MTQDAIVGYFLPLKWTIRAVVLPIHQRHHCMEAQPPTLSSRAKPRDLLCALTSNKGPTSELASLYQAVCSS